MNGAVGQFRSSGFLCRKDFIYMMLNDAYYETNVRLFGVTPESMLRGGCCDGDDCDC